MGLHELFGWVGPVVVLLILLYLIFKRPRPVLVKHVREVAHDWVSEPLASANPDLRASFDPGKLPEEAHGVWLVRFAFLNRGTDPLTVEAFNGPAEVLLPDNFKVRSVTVERISTTGNDAVGGNDPLADAMSKGAGDTAVAQGDNRITVNPFPLPQGALLVLNIVAKEDTGDWMPPKKKDMPIDLSIDIGDFGPCKRLGI